MLRFYYRWRYQKRQKRDSLTLPKNPSRGTQGLFQNNLGSYLSQSSVRGRIDSKFDLPRKRRAWLRLCIGIVIAGALIWLIAESASALFLFRN